MTSSSSLKNMFHITSTTTTLALASFLTADQHLIPSRNYQLRTSYGVGYPVERHSSGSFYSIWGENYEVVEQAQIITEFASKLLDASVELDSSFAEVVSKRFWDLI